MSQLPTLSQPALPTRVAGVGVAAGFVLTGIFLGGVGMNPYIDIPSLAIVGGCTAGLLTSVFGVRGAAHAIQTLISGGAERDLAHGTAFFVSAAALSIGCGAVGTLIGLVQMLQNMSDPRAIGPAMAVALLTVFYGLIQATLASCGALSIARREATGHPAEATAVVTALVVGVGGLATLGVPLIGFLAMTLPFLRGF